jgi:hypothetical protein
MKNMTSTELIGAQGRKVQIMDETIHEPCQAKSIVHEPVAHIEHGGTGVMTAMPNSPAPIQRDTQPAIADAA